MTIINLRLYFLCGILCTLVYGCSNNLDSRSRDSGDFSKEAVQTQFKPEDSTRRVPAVWTWLNQRLNHEISYSSLPGKDTILRVHMDPVTQKFYRVSTLGLKWYYRYYNEFENGKWPERHDHELLGEDGAKILIKEGDMVMGVKDDFVYTSRCVLTNGYEAKSEITKNAIQRGRLVAVDTATYWEQEGAPGPGWYFNKPGAYIPCEISPYFAEMDDRMAIIQTVYDSSSKSFSRQLNLFEVSSGEKLSSVPIEVKGWTRATVLIENHIFVYKMNKSSSKGSISCFNLQGELVWRKSAGIMPQNWGGTKYWGIQPIANNQQLVICSRNKSMKVESWDAETGAENWSINLSNVLLPAEREFDECISRNLLNMSTLDDRYLVLILRDWDGKGGRRERTHKRDFILIVNTAGEVVSAIPIENPDPANRDYHIRGAKNRFEIFTVKQKIEVKISD